MSRRAWTWLMVLALVVTGVIAAAGQIEIPGVSKIVRRPVEQGTGSKCAKGDLSACRELAKVLCPVTRIRCDYNRHKAGRHKNQPAFQSTPKQSRGGGHGTGNPHPPGGPPGGGHHAASPPPASKPPPTTPTPPPTIPRPCIIDALGVRVCLPGL